MQNKNRDASSSRVRIVHRTQKEHCLMSIQNLGSNHKQSLLFIPVMSKLLPSLLVWLLFICDIFDVVVASPDSKSILRPAFVSFSRPWARRSSAVSMSAAANKPGNGVMVVGSANQDLTSYTSILPTMGETVMGSSFETSCGGKGANQAVAASSLGIAPITMVCRVGQDSFGADLLSNFRK